MKWYDRIHVKLKELGWTGAELSRRAEIEIKTMYKYLDGKVENPRGNVLGRMAKAMGVTETWLRYGIEEPKVSHSNEKKLDRTYLQVPVINGRIFNLLVKGETNYTELITSSNLMPFIRKEGYSEKVVAIIIEDDRNAPDLSAGDIVLVDLNKAPEHGKYAMAAAGGQSLVAIYTLATRDRKPTNVLHFVGDNIPDIYLDDIDCEGLFRVIAITKHH